MPEVSDTAGRLAGCVADLDATSRRIPTLENDYDTKRVRFSVCEFLAAFQSALSCVVPRLHGVRRDSPVKHAGISGTSFREVACELALEQYLRLWIMTNADGFFRWVEKRKDHSFAYLSGDEVTLDDVMDTWDCIALELAELFADSEPIDAKFLRAGIDTETIAKPIPHRQPNGSNADRNKWFYQQRLAGKSTREIVALQGGTEFSGKFPGQRVGSPQAVSNAIKKHCDANGLDAP